MLRRARLHSQALLQCMPRCCWPHSGAACVPLLLCAPPSSCDGAQRPQERAAASCHQQACLAPLPVSCGLPQQQQQQCGHHHWARPQALRQQHHHHQLALLLLHSQPPARHTLRLTLHHSSRSSSSSSSSSSERHTSQQLSQRASTLNSSARGTAAGDDVQPDIGEDEEALLDDVEADWVDGASASGSSGGQLLRDVEWLAAGEVAARAGRSREGDDSADEFEVILDNVDEFDEGFAWEDEDEDATVDELRMPEDVARDRDGPGSV